MRTHIDAKPVVARQGSGGTAERQAKPETAVRLATLARGNTRAESPYRWANAQLLAARPQAPDHGPRMHVISKIDKPVTSPVPVVQRVRGLLKGTRVKLKKNADDKEPREGIIDEIVGDVYYVKQSPFADDKDSEIKDNYRQEFVEPFFSIGASARANDPETKHSDDQATGDEKTAARTSMGSQSMALAAQGSTIVFANVSELYEVKATRILTLLSRHPAIMNFLNDRGSNCIITLVRGTVPAHVDTPIEEQGGDVHVRLATWYFEKYELGYVMAMLSHEFGIHPIANATIGAEDTKNVPVEKGQQADHLVGANWNSARNAVYRNMVLETALLMDSHGATQVLDAFLMDCATILATNDRRAKGLLRSRLVADYYNEYRGYLKNLIEQKAYQQEEMKDLLLPPKKGADDVSLNYKQAASRLLTGYWSKASVKPQRSATDNRSASSRQQGQSAESNAAPGRTQSAPAQHSTDVKETKSSSPEIELTQFKRRPAVQPDIASSPASAAVNATRLPDRLAAGIEHLTGLAMDDMRVHYNSPKPAQLQALAYAQGADIHLGPGQQRQLPHEAWHVVQQKQGRVKPTLQMKGKAINDDHTLEREADHMGVQASHGSPLETATAQQAKPQVSPATSLGGGSHKVTAAHGGRPTGSVKLHDRGSGMIEVTDLGVDASHRGSGVGQRLLHSALRTGQGLGGQRVRLDADDKGSGRLINWYRQMGFDRTGTNERGQPSLEAPIAKVLGAVAQRRAKPMTGGAMVAQLSAAAAVTEKDKQPKQSNNSQDTKSASAPAEATPAVTEDHLIQWANSFAATIAGNKSWQAGKPAKNFVTLNIPKQTIAGRQVDLEFHIHAKNDNSSVFSGSLRARNVADVRVTSEEAPALGKLVAAWKEQNKGKPINTPESLDHKLTTIAIREVRKKETGYRNQFNAIEALLQEKDISDTDFVAGISQILHGKVSEGMAKNDLAKLQERGREHLAELYLENISNKFNVEQAEAKIWKPVNLFDERKKKKSQA